MRPKKAKHFVQETANKLDCSESLVEDVSSFYWSALRKAVSNLEAPSISVANLGTLKVRYNRIEKIRLKYKNYLQAESPETMTFNKHALQKHSKERIEKLDLLKEQLEEEYKRKQEIKQKRKEYVASKNLEEQREDPGRDQE